MKNIFKLMMALAILLTSYSCKKEEITPTVTTPGTNASKASIDVLIYRYGTEIAVPNVTLKLYGSGNMMEPIATKVTNSNGKAIFDNVTPGIYVIKYDSEDESYEHVIDEVYTLAGETTYISATY